MLRTGIFGFGGGPSVIPLIRYEAVSRYHWLKDEEFGEILAIANTLPGPIATKMAAYLGYKQKGTIGAFISVIAHVLPTCLAMVLLFTMINVLSYSTVIKGMISAVMPVIAVMLGQMTYEFASKTVKGLGKSLGSLLFVISFFMLQIISIHPAIVIVLFLTYGAIYFKRKSKLYSQNKEMSS
nr:chromate transporter [Anoxybacillus tepidamans]